MGTYRILIVEDDEVTAEQIKDALEKWDYCARTVADFRHVTEQVAQQQPDLIVLDIHLPFYNGFYWCREIRTLTKAPVIFLSSADDNMNIIMAMDMGGDDFIAKPFDTNVLVAKINAMLRRSYSYQGQTNLISAGSVILNTADATVANGGKRTELTKNEYQILRLLMENQGKMVSRDTLMQRLWDNEAFVDDNTLTVNVARIRKKLQAIDVPDMIKTKKGAGYLIEG